MHSELTLDDLIGNKAMKAQMAIAQGAARLHNRPIPHILLTGAAGCGKTSTARALAGLSYCQIFQTSAEGLKTAEDMAKVFRKFSEEGYDLETGEIVGEINPPILFVDEAHRLSLKTEEMMGIAMENFQHTFSIGRGKTKEVVTSWVPQFTLICATTKEGSLSKPFRDRFKLVYVFDNYSYEESVKVLELHARKKNLPISGQSIGLIALRGRGTPRVLVRYLERMADMMSYMQRDTIAPDLVEAQFELMGIDPEGLTLTDIRILLTLYNSEAPTGLEALSLRTNQDPKTVSEVNEPFLITKGLMERGQSGRLITDEGKKYLEKYEHVIPAIKRETRRIISINKNEG